MKTLQEITFLLKRKANVITYLREITLFWFLLLHLIFSYFCIWFIFRVTFALVFNLILSFRIKLKLTELFPVACCLLPYRHHYHDYCTGYCTGYCSGYCSGDRGNDNTGYCSSYCTGDRSNDNGGNGSKDCFPLLPLLAIVKSKVCCHCQG